MDSIDFSRSPWGCVRLDDERGVLDILKHTVSNLWEAVDNICQLRPTQRRHFHVAIFGSARVPAESALCQDVRDLAKVLADIGCFVVTGGGLGVMQAANEGALLGGKCDPNSLVGLEIILFT